VTATANQDIPDDQLAALIAYAGAEYVDEVSARDMGRAAYRLGYAAALGYEIKVVDDRVHIGDRHLGADADAAAIERLRIGLENREIPLYPGDFAPARSAVRAALAAIDRLTGERDQARHELKDARATPIFDQTAGERLLVGDVGLEPVAVDEEPPVDPYEPPRSLEDIRGDRLRRNLDITDRWYPR